MKVAALRRREKLNRNDIRGVLRHGGDPAVKNPQSPTAGNRGDPGSEALNPQTGGPALGQGQPAPAQGTIGQGPADRQVVPPNAQPDDAAKPVPPKNQ
jgi:hypothetical protein